LVNDGAAVDIVMAKDERPQLPVGSLEKITCLGLEHGVVVCDGNELQITLAFAECNVGKIGISLLAVFTDFCFNELATCFLERKGARREPEVYNMLPATEDGSSEYGIKTYIPYQ